MIRVADIQREVATRRGVPLDKMRRRSPFGFPPKKGPQIAKARQEAIFLACRLTRHSKNRLAYFFGVKDNTTILHAVRKVEQRMASNPADRAFVEELLSELES